MKITYKDLSGWLKFVFVWTMIGITFTFFSLILAIIGLFWAIVS